MNECKAQNVRDVSYTNCFAFCLEILYKLKISVLHIFLLRSIVLCAVVRRLRVWHEIKTKFSRVGRQKALRN